jgi:pimeloyl-ACP methyl ester carboxylesterase
MIPALAAAAAGYALERRWARTFDRPDPARDDELGLPADVEQRHLPTVDGGTTYVVEAGQGRPVVLLHGITFQAEAWAYQFELSDRARLLAVDLRGHGRSRVGRDGATIALCARDLRDLLEALDLRNAVLVGHSLGGVTMGQFLADHPDVAAERVGAYGLISTAGKTVLGLPLPLMAAVADRLVADAETGGRLSAGLRRVPRSDLGELGLRRAFGREPSRRHVDALAQAYESLPAMVQGSLIQSLVHFDALEAWSRLDRPAAILVGDRDRVIPPRASAVLAEAMPHARYEVFKGAGHMLMYERPRQVSAVLSDLIAS